MPNWTCKLIFIQAIIQNEYLSRQKYKINFGGKTFLIN